MTISLCMIVKDEAANLPGCLDSAAPWVDEIVILDTGSSDDTRAVAQRYQAQVHAYEWTRDFAAARNACLEYATGDWIWVVDADERLDISAARQLQALDRGEPLQGVAAEDVLAVALLRQEIGTEQSPYTLLVRCFRHRDDIRFERPYHETVDDSIMALQAREPHWQVVTLPKVAMYHSGYQAAVVAERGKFERAQPLMERYVEQHPQDGYLLNKLGALYLQKQDPRAVEVLQRGLAAESLDPVTTYELHYHLGIAHRRQQDFAQAEHHYRAALAQPVPPQLQLGAYINLGSLLKHMQQLQPALEMFQRVIATDSTVAIAHFNLGVIHRAQGDLAAAIDAYRTALQYQPSYPQAHQNLGVALYKQGQFIDALVAFRTAIELYEASDSPEQAQQLRQGIQNLGLPPEMLAKHF